MLMVFVPATSANLGPGFDCLGLALPFGNLFEIRLAEGESATYRLTGGEAVPLERNLFLEAAERTAQLLGQPLPGLEVVCTEGIPRSRGLGSSASATLGGVLCANRLFGDPLDRTGILRLATELEGHPDNVAPALLGGVTVSVRAGERVVTQPIQAPSGLGLVLAVPGFALSTAQARAALPAVVPLDDAVYNVGRAALLTALLSAGRLDALPDALDDRLHEPYRQSLVPGMAEVSEAARQAGAWGVTLSGAGPTLLAWCPRDAREGIAQAMRAAWEARGIPCRAIATEIGSRGASTTSDAAGAARGAPWP